MTLFRPCIDLHGGKVKQIVGATLSDSGQGLRTNFVSEKPAEFYAALYQKDNLRGGHVIMLGSGNEAAAQKALSTYPNALQIGGGINPENAENYLKAGASHVIVTSYLFENGEFSESRLNEISRAIDKKHLVLDLSCKRTANGWAIATNRWQTLTHTEITKETLSYFSTYCSEFLIHAADVEGKQQGIDEKLIVFLATNSPIPVTYAGGAKNIQDLELCQSLSNGKIDMTIGSALDIFGGNGAKYADCVAFNRRNQ